MRDKDKIEKLIDKGRHFCMSPWIHLNINTLGNMVPCCITDKRKGYGSLNENSLHELWQGEKIRKLRLEMLEDKKCDLCEKCYDSERAGKRSKRMKFNSNFKEYIDYVLNTDESGYSPDAKPVFMDIRLSNLCNLKCRTCGPDSSSSWSAENMNSEIRDVFGIQDKKKLLNEIEEYLPYVKNIKFSGGEPLLQEENNYILEKLRALGKNDVEVYYITNFTMVRRNNYEIVDLWKNMKNIRVSISLDGSSKRGEYIRKGLNWDEIAEDIKKVKKECPNIKFKINTTMTVFNIFHLPDFHKELVKKGLADISDISLNILFEPKYLNIRILTPQLKMKAEKKIRDHIFWLNCHKFGSKQRIEKIRKVINEWIICIKYLKIEDWTFLIPKFIEITNNLDKKRNEKCLEIFPELASLFEYTS